MFYCYILFDNLRFYIGSTKDLKRRIIEHKYGKVKSTKYRKELKLIFYEAFLSEKDAKRREKYFKTTKGKKSLKLILRESIITNCRVV